MLRQFRDNFMSAARGGEQWVAAEAAKRAAADKAAGMAASQEYMMSRPAETVAGRVASQFGKGEKWRDQMVRNLSDPGRRSRIAAALAPQLNRGPFQLTKRGFGEAMNQGIAENKYIRRGLLPTAIGGGGLMAGAAVTTGAQNLMALMQYMQAGDQQQERVEQSPLA
jgi:hypothetical protein